jgi:hypothetical protein
MSCDFLGRRPELSATNMGYAARSTELLLRLPTYAPVCASNLPKFYLAELQSLR